MILKYLLGLVREICLDALNKLKCELEDGTGMRRVWLDLHLDRGRGRNLAGMT